MIEDIEEEAKVAEIEIVPNSEVKVRPLESCEKG